MDSTLSAHLVRSAEAASALAVDAGAPAVLHAMAETIAGGLITGGKIPVAGNGGRAADAHQSAAEFVSGAMPGPFGRVFRAPTDNLQIVRQLPIAAPRATLAPIERGRFET